MLVEEKSNEINSQILKTAQLTLIALPGQIEGRRLRQARAVRRECGELESRRKGDKVAESLARCAHNPSHVLASIIHTQTDASATARSPMRGDSISELGGKHTVATTLLSQSQRRHFYSHQRRRGCELQISLQIWKPFNFTWQHCGFGDVMKAGAGSG
jgi:hypothetical protein